MNIDDRAKRILKYAVLLILIIGLIMLALFKFSVIRAFVNKFVSLITPLIVGCVAAFIVNVPMTGFNRLFLKLKSKSKAKHKMSDRVIEIISLLLAILFFSALIAVVCIVVLPRIVQSVMSIYNQIMESYPKALTFLESHNIDTTVIRQWIKDIDLMKILTTLKDNARNILDTISVAASSVAGVLVNAITGIVLAVYILANKKLLSRQCKRLLYAFCKKPTGDKICDIASLSYYTFSNFISGQAVECVILCLMFLIVLGILDIPYAVVISVLIAVLAVIPYIGAFAGCAAGVLLILMAEPKKAILFIIVFIVLQQIENQLIYPRVVGKSVGLPPMWTLLAAILGGKLFGILGLLSFIPFTSVLYTLLQTNMRKRLVKKGITVQETDGAVVEKAPQAESADLKGSKKVD